MKKIMVCCGTGCTSSKSEEIILKLKEYIKEKNIASIIVQKTGCFGFCAKGPILVVMPDEVFYEQVKPEDSKEIIDAIESGSLVERLLPKEKDKFIKKWHQLQFYNKQVRIALRHSGKINPESIDDYINADGYLALKKAVTQMTPQDVIDRIDKAMLRGRGGAGYPTAKKWQAAANEQSDTKYIVCNADEGDPGAFMDRSILEGDPHSVIEAMEIAGYAIGATSGYIYVRAEYPIAVERLKIAISEAKERGYIGKNIFGTSFCFNIELRLGAGAFVCGEETALLNSIEGKRGEPRLKPPYPAQGGLFGKPTVINNVETLANVPYIILEDIEEYKKIGTDNSKGTKVFALSGNITNVGLVEVPMGTTIREIVEDIGGGVPHGRRFKACQMGGPSGGCIPSEYIDTKIDYESLKELGAMMGSGGLIVMDDSKCMVNIAKFFLEFSVDESCGKCTPCRIGTKRMLEILTRITEGKGEVGDIEKLEYLGKQMAETSLCGLGQSAANPVLSTIKYFRDEYEMHIKEKRCLTGECKALARYEINPDICKQCGVCKKNCPVGAIEGEPKQGAYKIIQNKCIKCGTCYGKCPFGAIGVK